MKPIGRGQRIVRNIHTAPYRRFSDPRIGDHGVSFLPLDEDREEGSGLYIYRMEPGAVASAHEHTSDEYFLVLSGEITDNDGTLYREGDMVLLREGTQHSARTRKGCTLLVFNDTVERSIEGD